MKVLYWDRDGPLLEFPEAQRAQALGRQWFSLVPSLRDETIHFWLEESFFFGLRSLKSNWSGELISHLGILDRARQQEGCKGTSC